VVKAGDGRAAVAGAVAAAAWGVLEPLDQRLLGCDYSDVALLGKAVTRGRGWRVVGFALHAGNGAAFGLVFNRIRRSVRIEPGPLAVGLALAEHAALFPLVRLVDRYHPARGQPGIPRLARNRAAYVQASIRHMLFGAIVGRLA
jgi:hypothetical protein